MQAFVERVADNGLPQSQPPASLSSSPKQTCSKRPTKRFPERASILASVLGIRWKGSTCSRSVLERRNRFAPNRNGQLEYFWYKKDIMMFSGPWIGTGACGPTSDRYEQQSGMIRSHTDSLDRADSSRRHSQRRLHPRNGRRSEWLLPCAHPGDADGSGPRWMTTR